MSSIRPVSSKAETISDGFGLDVGVEQVAHAGLVLLEVDVLAGAELDLVADVLVVGDLGLDGGGFGVGVAGCVHLVGEVGVGADKRGDGLVERDALRLVVLELLGVAVFRRTEVVLVLERVLRRRDRLAQGADLSPAPRRGPRGPCRGGPRAALRCPASRSRRALPGVVSDGAPRAT